MSLLAIDIKFEKEEERKQERRKVFPKWARNYMKNTNCLNFYKTLCRVSNVVNMNVFCTQLVITCSKLIIEALEQEMKYVQS